MRDHAGADGRRQVGGVVELDAATHGGEARITLEGRRYGAYPVRVDDAVIIRKRHDGAPAAAERGIQRHALAGPGLDEPDDRQIAYGGHRRGSPIHAAIVHDDQLPGVPGVGPEGSKSVEQLRELAGTVTRRDDDGDERRHRSGPWPRSARTIRPSVILGFPTRSISARAR